MNLLQLPSFLTRLDFNKVVSDQRSRDGLGSLVYGVAAGLALGYFAAVCIKQSGQCADEADMRRKGVGLQPSADVTIPTETVAHTLGWHTNARGMVMCNQQFIPKCGEVKGVVGICHGFSDHTHGFIMEFAIKLCNDGFAVLTMDVEVGCSEKQ
jgi:hypothetical protein